MSLGALISTTRPSFLLLTPVCVFLGYSIALPENGNISYPLLVLVLIGALIAHIAVNMLNEYEDFRSGLDFLTVKTPFSGGSGALPMEPVVAPRVLAIVVVLLGVLFLIGIYLIYSIGLNILPIGILGIMLILTYTRWLNRYPWLCLVAPGAGFGLFMVLGTYIVLTGHYTVPAVLVSFVPFFLVNNLLLLNQYPDVDADRKIGRRHLPITYGIRFSNLVYGLFMLGAALSIILLVIFTSCPTYVLVALLPLGVGVYALHGAHKYGVHVGQHPSPMAANVVAVILTSLVLAVLLILGGNTSG